MEKTYTIIVKIMGTVHTFTVTATTHNWQVYDKYTPKGENTEEEVLVMSGGYTTYAPHRAFIMDSNNQYSLIYWELSCKVKRMIESDKALMKAIKADWEAFMELEAKFNRNK